MVSVTVSIVNFNHAPYLAACLKAVRAQTLKPEAIIIVDNASSDGSAELLSGIGEDITVIRNPENRGYAGGHNQAFRLATSEYVMALNCDVALDPDFLNQVVATMDRIPSAGSGGGRLYRGTEGQVQALDSTGLFPDRLRRFHDRRDEPGNAFSSQLPSAIFGPSGSAATFRKAMLDDVASDGQYFDEDFFAYCEDADLAWRAQRRGWSALYVPTAVGWHIHEDMSRARSSRRDGDANFRQLLLIRNRHLCFLKNDTLLELLRDSPWLLGYDLALEAYLLARKPRLALRWPVEVVRYLPRILRKRKVELARGRNQVRIATWFDWERDRPV